MRAKKLLALLIAPMFAIGMTACDVDQTEEGEMPEVEVQEGELPAYDVDAADVEVTEDTVTVPDIDVNPPEDDDGEGMTEGEDVEGGL
jgi:hypothetical protein